MRENMVSYFERLLLITVSEDAMRKTLAILVVTLLATAGCTWVSLAPSGDNVRVVSPSEVKGCKRIGQTEVALRDTLVGTIKRDERKVAKELTTLGRNSAAEMGGDTITSASDILNGSQKFDVYKCMP